MILHYGRTASFILLIRGLFPYTAAHNIEQVGQIFARILSAATQETGSSKSHGLFGDKT